MVTFAEQVLSRQGGVVTTPEGFNFEHEAPEKADRRLNVRFHKEDEEIKINGDIKTIDRLYVEIAQPGDREVFDKLELSHIRSDHIMPVRIKDGCMVIATCNPENIFALDDVKRQVGMEIKVIVSTLSDIEAICNEFDESNLVCTMG